MGDLCITPTPKRAPKILLGGMAPPAIDRAARIADGFLCTGGIGMDVYVEALKNNGKSPEEGNIILGCWAIIAEDPEAEAANVGEHVLYQSNEYIRWGAFGPPDQTPLFPDARSAIDNGLYELWDADMAVRKTLRHDRNVSDDLRYSFLGSVSRRERRVRKSPLELHRRKGPSSTQRVIWRALLQQLSSSL